MVAPISVIIIDRLLVGFFKVLWAGKKLKVKVNANIRD